jgi:glycosyltransferase involved in cell wall biosynthesis
MLFSIVTVSFNSEKTIAKTIDSVLNQNFNDFEYIIIDGASNDKTLEIIKSYSDKFVSKNIPYKIISEKDNGVYNAMNKGINQSSGKYVAFINSDDWYESNALKSISELFFIHNSDVIIAGTNILRNNEIIYRKIPTKTKIISSQNWVHPSTFVSKKIFLKLGKFIEKNIYDDFDFYLKMIKNRINIFYSNIIISNFSLGGLSTKKYLKDLFRRIYFRYYCYKNNGFSKLYFFHVFLIEIYKYLFS